MKLLTGRRHQLRVHSLCLNHAIVGDYTYNQQYKNNEDSNITISTSISTSAPLLTPAANNNNNTINERITAERMMLHSYKLK